MKTLVFTYYKIVDNFDNGEFCDRSYFTEFAYALKSIHTDYDWWDPDRLAWIYRVDIFKCDDGDIEIKETVMYEKS